MGKPWPWSRGGPESHAPSPSPNACASASRITAAWRPASPPSRVETCPVCRAAVLFAYLPHALLGRRERVGEDGDDRVRTAVARRSCCRPATELLLVETNPLARFRGACCRWAKLPTRPRLRAALRCSYRLPSRSPAGRATARDGGQLRPRSGVGKNQALARARGRQTSLAPKRGGAPCAAAKSLTAGPESFAGRER
jgi:hypothetical protein